MSRSEPPSGSRTAPAPQSQASNAAASARERSPVPAPAAAAAPAGDTRQQILDAAEALFAQTGIAHTSTRAILRASGQRNESALQYHFGGRDGLVAALHARRMAQVEQLRQERLAAIAPDLDLDLRDILEMQVMPFVDRARADAGFVHYLCAIGEVVFSPRAKLMRLIDHYDIGSDATLRTQMRRVLASHDADAMLRRADLCRRFMIMSLSQWCREHGSLDGPASAQFVVDLLDMMTAMLTAGEPPRGT